MESPDFSDLRCRTCGGDLDPTILDGGCVACLFAGVITGEEREMVAGGDFPEIEGYKVVEEVGSGGMGVVYRARQENPTREVALKIVAPFSLRAMEARARFLVEIEAMAAVEHRGLLPLYDAGEDEYGRPWLTMLLASGGTLAEHVASYNGEWRKVAELLVLLCEAIQYAHERGILHRDLKPANILFDDEGNAYVADFGLAKWADGDSSFTQSATMLGSPAYLAPESARGGSKETTTVSDVYGLGAILYELLVGAKPYEGENATEVLAQILDRAPLPPRQRFSKVPRDLDVIAMKAMARDPEKRYHSAAALADDLRRWLEGHAIWARPVGLVERGVIWARRNPAVATLSFFFLGSLVTGGILLWRSNQELEASLDDVEARVEFMTRELPDSLGPLGRLDLLDDVFENVSEHYEERGRDDAESLARHADFLTQWSQILRPRGQLRGAIERSRLALDKAEEAVAGGSDSVEVARARVLAGWRLAGVLSEAGEVAEARAVLKETEAFAERSKKKDLRFEELQARLTTQFVILETEEGNFKEAIRQGGRARKQWEELLPKLKAEPKSPWVQKALIGASEVYYYLYNAQRQLGLEEETQDSFDRWVRETRELHEGDLENFRFRYGYAIARLLMVRRGMVSDEQARDLLADVEDDYLFLLSRDPGNLRWEFEAASCAVQVALNARRRNADEEYWKWVDIAAKRIRPHYQLRSTTNYKFLISRRELAGFCGSAFVERDWDRARIHLEASVQAQNQIVKIVDGTEEAARLERMIGRVGSLIEGREGQTAAEQWKSRIETAER